MQTLVDTLEPMAPLIASLEQKPNMDATNHLKIALWKDLPNSAQQAIRNAQYAYRGREYLVIFVPQENYEMEWDVIMRLCHPFSTQKCVGPLFCVMGHAHRSYIIPNMTETIT